MYVRPTAHKAVELLASGLEVLGTFLLAVEAIKLENLQRLREGLFERALRHLIPRILVREAATAEEINEMKEHVHMRFFLLFAVIGFPVLLLAAMAVAGSRSALWVAGLAA